MINVKVYRVFDEAHLPIYGSRYSACFDLSASIKAHDLITIMSKGNAESLRRVSDNKDIPIYSGERCLIPTGLIFDLERDQSLRIHPRSGLSWKKGITIANCEGVIDSDYIKQTYIMLYNISNEPFMIEDGMRVAQGEIVLTHLPACSFQVTYKEPKPKTNRTGGFGSTGIKKVY